MSVFHIIMILLATYIVGLMVTAFVTALFKGRDCDGFAVLLSLLWPILVPLVLLTEVGYLLYSLPATLGEYFHKKLTPDGE